MESILTPSQAASVLAMHPETLRRWEENGRIKSQRTPGGHRRYLESDVLKLKAEIESGKHLLQGNRAETVPSGQAEPVASLGTYEYVPFKLPNPPKADVEDSAAPAVPIGEPSDPASFNQRMLWAGSAFLVQVIVFVLMQFNLNSANSTEEFLRALTGQMLVSVVMFAAYLIVALNIEKATKIKGGLKLQLPLSALPLCLLVSIGVFTLTTNGRVDKIEKANQAETQKTLSVYQTQIRGACIRSQAKLEVASPVIIETAVKESKRVTRKENQELLVRYKSQLDRQVLTLDKEC